MTLTYTFSAGRKRKLSAGLGLATATALMIALPSTALAQDGDGSGGVGMGGEGTTPPTTGQTTPGPKAKLKDGFAIPPASAPRKVVRAIEAANEIVKGKPYCMGGGHGRRRDTLLRLLGLGQLRAHRRGPARRLDALRLVHELGEGRQRQVDHHLRQRAATSTR